MTQLHWSAAARLLDRDMPHEYMAEMTAIASAKNHIVVPGTQSVLIFRLGTEWFSLPTHIFQEVAEGRKVHSLPHRGGGILRGLVNVGGELLLCVALDTLLGMETSPEANDLRRQTTNDQLLVCNRKGDKVAFFVSEVHGLHRFHPRDLRGVPSTVAKAAATYTVGLLHWNGSTVGCLDDELLFYALNKGFA